MTDFGAGSTKINEVMNTVVAEGIQYFRLFYQCTDPGTASPVYVPLQDTGVFVYEIIDPGDTTKDLFTRITDIPDFAEYSNNRNTAILSGSNFWRSSTAALSYTDFATANAAKNAMHDRLDTLCQDFSTYSLQFLTLPAGNTGKYPLAVIPNTVVDQLADAYYTAYEAYLASMNGDPLGTPPIDGWQYLLDNYNFKDALVTLKATAKTTADALSASLTYACQYYHAFVMDASDGSNAKWFLMQTDPAGAHPADAADWAAFDSRRNNEDTGRATKICADAAAAAIAAGLAGAEYNTALADRLTANTTLQAKHDALVILNAAVTTAHTAVLTACPAFEDPRGYDIADLPPVPAMP